MINTNLYKSHFWVYWKTQRILFLFFFTILFVNLTIQLGVSIFVNGSIEFVSIISILPPIVGFLLGMLIAIPAMGISSFPYLLTFGSRRKDIVYTATANNILYVIFLSIIFSFLIGITGIISKELPQVYMGTIITSWGSLVPITVLNLFLLLMISSITFLISAVFYRWGVLWGLGFISLVISVPILLINEIYHFYIWGGSYTFINILMMTIIVTSTFLSIKILSKAEIHHSRPILHFKGFVFLVCCLTILSLAFYTGINRLTNASDIIRVNDHGRFAYFEDGEKEKNIISKGNQDLVLLWRSQVSEGDLTFTLTSPSGEIVYAASGTTNDLVTIPLTPGMWSYSLTFDDATNSNYSLLAYVRD
ncbi:MAG: hypothetical protein APF76_01390 [Desulfitibacter sp. BRH_c19]|nr:MAG: hypothetical protein APF76_01390 [Desulfitibacter sp. BRH_c19]